jgi:hypothetical protein
MNAALAKPIRQLLVYSGRGVDKALISLKHLLRRRGVRCAASRGYPSSIGGKSAGIMILCIAQ